MAVQLIQQVEEIMGNWRVRGPISNCLIFLDFLTSPIQCVRNIYFVVNLCSKNEVNVIQLKSVVSCPILNLPSNIRAKSRKQR